MSEKLLELQKQCVIHDKGTVLDFDYDKFAKLIVRECAAYISVLDAEPVSHKSAAKMLMNHFGVE